MASNRDFERLRWPTSPSGGDQGEHSLHIPGQGHPIPLALDLVETAERELTETHHRLDDAEHRVGGLLPERVPSLLPPHTVPDASPAAIHPPTAATKIRFGDPRDGSCSWLIRYREQNERDHRISPRGTAKSGCYIRTARPTARIGPVGRPMGDPASGSSVISKSWLLPSPGSREPGMTVARSPGTNPRDVGPLAPPGLVQNCNAVWSPPAQANKAAW